MRWLYATPLALLAAASAASTTVPAGEIHYSPVLDHDMVPTTLGSSINWITGVVDDAAGQSSWNPFKFGPPDGVYFLWPPGGAGAGMGSESAYAVLAPGTVVGPGSVFTRSVGPSATAAWRMGADGYLGFKVSCPAGTCYGYARLKSTAPSGFPLTLASYAYHTGGAAITVEPLPTGGNSNGIIRSALLNHAIAAVPTGTSLNIVSGTLDDVGPIDADWDFNFFSDHGRLRLWKVDGGGTGHYALDASGKARLVPPGERIGPGSVFSSGYGSVAVADDWLAGSDGYLGVKFNCDGRLTFPVAGGVCYGYVHINTTGPTGFPAMILDTVFDGDGNAIAVSNPPPPVPPEANVSPVDGFDFIVDTGVTGTDTLVIGNTGGSNLTWSIAESGAARTNPPSYRNTLAAKNATGTYDSSATLASARSQGINGSGQPLVLDTTTISQMEDITPGDEGVSCGTTGVSTADNSWWRRFYFNEHPQVGASANIISVTVSTGSIAVAGSLPTTINLYTIPHSTPVNTIPTSALTLIGTTTATVNGSLATTTIPVSGTVSDTAGQDLVIEWHTDGTPAGQYFPGANATAETHPTFLSSSTCGVSQPTSASSLAFPDFHLILMATFGEGDDVGCLSPSDIPWLSTAPSSGAVAPGASSNVAVTVDASTLAEGTYSANLCVSVNDPVLTLITVPVRLTVNAVAASDGFFCNGFESGEDGSCAASVLREGSGLAL